MSDPTPEIYCEEEVKKNDYYRYICCLFAPHKTRMKLLSLYAFNYEISKIKDITSEHMTGLIRLTWWIEAINEIYSGKKIRDHEVVKALADVVKSTEIPREYFEHMILAREVDLGLKPLQTSEDFEKYITDTAVNLLKVSLHITSTNGDETYTAASHIGHAYAIIGIMRAIKWNAAKKNIFLPHDMLEKHSINIDDIADGYELAKFKPVVKELCAKVDMHLKKAKALKKSLRKQAMPIYLHSIVAGNFLRRIRKNNYDLFHSDLEHGKFGMLMKIYFAARFG